MRRFSPGLRISIAALTAAATLARANPYQSRLDREYKSLSNAISRAYSPPPPTPARSYSTPSYSSSSTSRSYSSSSSSRSSSGSSNWSPPTESYRQRMGRLEDERRAAESSYRATQAAAAERKREAQAAAAAKAAERRRREAAEREERERERRRPTHSPQGWASLREKTQGKAPLTAPPWSALESRRSEFEYFSAIARQRGAQAPWENLRAGQLCLLFQGNGAEPSRAFEFFARSDVRWPEVQLGLGLCYLRGYGVVADPAKAREQLEKAATYVRPAGLVVYTPSGEVMPDSAWQASRELAVAYDLGQGLPADAALAAQWYGRARQRPLLPRDHEELVALQRDFWKRHADRARDLMERELSAAKESGHVVHPDVVFRGLVDAGHAQALYDIGELIDLNDARGQTLTNTRRGMSFFLAAAKLGHDAAARAYFSPARNGYFQVVHDDLVSWAGHDHFIHDQWPVWEKKWLAAAAAGDAAANIPLALYYAGGRAYTSDAERAKRHAAAMPAGMPAAQRKAIEIACTLGDAREKETWAATVFARFGATSKTIDVRRLAGPADPARGAALREEGIVRAQTQPQQARDFWRDAAALGDLPAQVQLYLYAKRHQVYLGDFDKSLRGRLEAAADGDRGATASLAVLMDGSVNNELRFSTATYEIGQTWRTRVLALAPEQERFQQIARNPALTDERCAEVAAAARQESEAWRAVARTWGLEGFTMIGEVTLSAEEIRAVEAMRAQYVALAASARQLTAQLALWEKTVEATEFDPEADARFLQGYEAWQGYDQSERDLARAVDYFAQSTGLGHPMAPLVLAYFFGSGHGGFPQDAELSRRYRALSDARLTALAEDDNGWAQTMLGSLLIDERADRQDTAASPGAYEWLPLDKARGFRWLQAAATNGATLPPNFGDSRGQTVAWYLSQRYYDEKDQPACAKWKVIDEVWREQLGAAGVNDAAWNGALAVVQKILAESPAAEKARVEIDEAVDSAENDLQQSVARGRRALALEALGLRPLAVREALQATRLAIQSPAPWKILAPLQEAAGQRAEAELSFSMVQALENGAGGLKRFEAALPKVDADWQENIQALLGFALEEQPQSAVLKNLKASADRIVKPRKE